ncbi:MAG: hypothetical protein ABSH32_31580 [Bryobacteraceae bacterium]|jgi:hypothetical protein
MHRLTVLILFPLLMLFAADAGLAGRYAGEWKSNGAGGGGSFRMSLEAQSGGAWKCEFGFTFSGEEVKTTMHACKVEQSKLEATYDFDLQGNALRSKITGKWDGKAFAGQYETTAGDGGDAVDDGTWTMAPAAAR